MAKKKLQYEAPEIDVRSADVLLRYTGQGRRPWNTPGRDLHGGDIARLAHVRALAASSGLEAPAPASAEQLAAIHAELVATGAFEPWTPDTDEGTGAPEGADSGPSATDGGAGAEPPTPDPPAPDVGAVSPDPAGDPAPAPEA